MRNVLSADIESLGPYANALVDHVRVNEHDTDLCAICLRDRIDRLTEESNDCVARQRQQSDLDAINARELHAIAAIVGHGRAPGCAPLVDDVARIAARAADAAALEAGRWPRLNTIESFVGRVAQLPCVHGRARQDGPCAAYERPPVTVASADLAIDLLCCPPCAARRLMADAEAARAPAAPTIRCANSYEGGGVLITDEELARLARGDT